MTSQLLLLLLHDVSIPEMFNQIRYRKLVNSAHSFSLYISVSFFARRGGLLKIGGDQVFFLRSKGGIKRFFQIKKGGSLIFFKERKYFDKHFRTQMEFLLILQKRCSYESVSCCNSSKRG